MIYRYVDFKTQIDENNIHKTIPFASNLLKNDISNGIISKMTKFINKKFGLTSLSINQSDEVTFGKSTSYPYNKYTYFYTSVNTRFNNNIESTGTMVIWPKIIKYSDLFKFWKTIKQIYEQNKNDFLAKEIYDEFIGENEEFLNEINKIYYQNSGGLVFFESKIFYKKQNPQNIYETESTITTSIPLSYDGKYRFIAY